MASKEKENTTQTTEQEERAVARATAVQNSVLRYRSVTRVERVTPAGGEGVTQSSGDSSHPVMPPGEGD